MYVHVSQYFDYVYNAIESRSCTITSTHLSLLGCGTVQCDVKTLGTSHELRIFPCNGIEISMVNRKKPIPVGRKRTESQGNG